MYNLLVKLMITSALLQFGMSLTRFHNCNSGKCVQQIEKQSRDVLPIEWRPISVFPEEAKRFR